MAIEICTPTEEDVEELFRVDGRAFGWVPKPEDIAERRGTLELARFRVAVDGKQIVGISGAYTLDLTLPGGGTVPASGVTWVGVAATHRRLGIMSRMLEALHHDAADRGEPVAILTASESGIYGRFGYGVASHFRTALITKSQATFRPGTPGRGPVRYSASTDELLAHVPALYDRYRVTSPGEISRNENIWRLIFALRAKGMDELSATFWLLHADGYACYRVQDRWNDGHPAHRIEVTEFVALTDAARGALWRTILSLDLAGEISTRTLALDDPLGLWLSEPRAIRTSTYNDWMWVKPLDIATLLKARTYGADGRLVVEVGQARYAVEATDGRATVTKVRSKPDVTTDDAGLGALLLGGVRVSTLARAGRLHQRDAAALRRADAMFAGDRLPLSQTPF